MDYNNIPFDPAKQAKVLTIGDIEYMAGELGREFGEYSKDAYLTRIFDGVRGE